MNKFELGSKVRDKHTGFEGTVTGHGSYLTGCDQYLVQPRADKDGKYINATWLDEGQLEAIDGCSEATPESEDLDESEPDKDAAA